MSKYYYSTNGNGKTHNEEFEPFKDGDVAEAPDWDPDPSIACGNALHIVSDNPIKALKYVGRTDPVYYEVKPQDRLPCINGKYRCRALTRIRKLGVREIRAFIVKASESRDVELRAAAAEDPRVTLATLRKLVKDRSERVQFYAERELNRRVRAAKRKRNKEV